MDIRLSGIIESSINNGEGIRKVIFAQGCKHNCKGCFNKSTHDFNGGELCDSNKIIDRINKDFIIDGVTFSGGDPFEQAEAFLNIAKNIDKSIWCYTGYTFEEILNSGNNTWIELLNNIDVLVDGKFEIENASDCKYKGSTNQRIIDVKNSLYLNDKIIEIDK